MDPSQQPPQILILGAGVIGLTTALVLSHTYPHSQIRIVAAHFPGDRSLHYASPWAGANWSSMATDNGPLEHYDAVTYRRFGELVDGVSVFGCRAVRAGEGNEMGLGRMGMWGVFDAPVGECGVLSEGTGKVWYEELVGGLRMLEERERPAGSVWGMEVKSTFRVNTQVYLQWSPRLQTQALSKGIPTTRRHYPSLTTLLTDHPTTTLLINCTGLGPLTLSDIQDNSLYPTRGQTLLIAEPKVPISRMYFRAPARLDPTTTYIFPRPLGGGIILGGSRQDYDWSGTWDETLGQDILERCCALCPELGRPSDLQVLARNIGLRPSRKGGPRIEIEAQTRKWNVPVIHAYGHAGAGYQSSWGTAERVLELVGEVFASTTMGTGSEKESWKL
ncbi:hypothetical protein BDW02DRAFT_104958 [Decorospora gaudefroyi]|uniref:FAD dependent oxidoreductase domain-containing protein n=1 Tax=Decorospora gaudefroyi TaxID=184978 RepID=A0A6A5JYW0_9PLEO|nr:hypothetical protein BDW02DRAFT_104958 [Decorospora gaudefroyi]